MLSSLLLASTLQIGPFFEKGPDSLALRPIMSYDETAVDVLWPVFTKHRDWWRFCYIINYQSHSNGEGHQFSFLPFYFSGSYPDKGEYMGFFPLYGRHPNIALFYDLEYVLWPVWMRYKTPRGNSSVETSNVLFPFISWSSDGSWGVWPFYGIKYHRESEHRYAFWPFSTSALYQSDRDTSGAGYSWMVWPFYGEVVREREKQVMMFPPFFSFAETSSSLFRGGKPSRHTSIRVRSPWPFFEYEDSLSRKRISIFPFYESVKNYSYKEGATEKSVKRFGWRLVELYDDETRVFPFWVKSKEYFRLWPFCEVETSGGVKKSRYLSLIPIRHIPAVDRNLSKFWTIYETRSSSDYVDHSALWGLIRWRTSK